MAGKDARQAARPRNEAEETVEAIHRGNVDAVVVQGPSGPQVIMLQGADAPYHVLVERMSDGALTLDADGSIVYVNSRLCALTGLPADQIVGRTFSSLFAGSAPQQRADDAASDAQLQRVDGDDLPVSVWMRQMAMGGVVATLVTLTDMSIQRRAEEVANAERFARSILEQATDAVVVLALDGRITHASWVAEQLAGRTPVGQLFSAAFPLDAQSASQQGTLTRFSRESLDRALATKPFHGVEVRLRDERMSGRSFLLSGGPLVNDAKETVGSIVTLTDITDRKRAEEQQTMLVAELNHRVKNILAIVQSVAGQTLRTSPSLPAFNKAFSGRIQAVSIAHDILTQTRWIGIGFNELLTTVLAPYGVGEGRISIEGPPVLLEARLVLPLSMVLHELATNASKYGALSAPFGQVAISWRLCDDRRRLELVWLERGGPVIEGSGSRGFGTTLIDRVVRFDLDGEAELDFARDGIRCTLRFALTAETAPEQVPASAVLPH
ncbi:putative signal transduction histidine kinase with PAS/PAC domains [Bradyrhizobium sp. ORS 375]|uniref:sensor histidine kinase n=1 Tax=Bradyrhizobium sp. (strain ORS 375) TaxID=566679 RepID=UPI000240A1B1|nr:HWE histidine kinase domain-containing protein [Bradyrhizobium sp. ORS 375]CCD93430.1 putative signal transduction histidine kinase with PAS/PAC domains [Bradyrhizobium sp. ORS 375]